MTLLRLGSKGEEVVLLQQKLSLNDDGIFGLKTLSAVKIFQSNNGLADDGVVGEQTWKKLLNEEYVQLKKNPQPNNYKQYDKRWSKIRYSTWTSSQTIGNSGCAITAIANLVSTWWDKSVTPPDMAKLSVEWGCRSKNSGTSRSFHKLIAEKYGASQFIRTNSFDTAKAAVQQGAYATCSMGPGRWTKGSHVVLLWWVDDNNVYINDPASAATNRAVAPINLFKSQCNQYYIFFNGMNNPEKVPSEEETTPAETAENPSFLSFGSKGEEVKTLQTTLNTLGYDCGKIDGIFGEQTRLALRQFQYEFSLDETGVLDDNTADAIENFKDNTEKISASHNNGSNIIIDVSKWQGTIDWKEVADNKSCALAIIRAGFGQNTIDDKFYYNIYSCHRYHIPYAVYWYSYAKSVDAIKTEMANFYLLCKDFGPLFYSIDCEESCLSGEIIDSGTKYLYSIGAKKIVNYIANHQLARYACDTSLPDAIWIPKYSSVPPAHTPCDLWQYSSTISIDGVGRCDHNKIPESGRFSIDWFLN